MTAGNASGVNDGAAAMLVASEAAVKQHGLKPMAKILGMATAGSVLHTNLETSFSFVYLLFRVLIGPAVMAPTTYALLFSKQGKDNLPLWIRLFWSLMIWAVIFGSYSWIVFCYGMLDKNLNLSGTAAEL